MKNVLKGLRARKEGRQMKGEEEWRERNGKRKFTEKKFCSAASQEHIPLPSYHHPTINLHLQKVGGWVGCRRRPNIRQRGALLQKPSHVLQQELLSQGTALHSPLTFQPPGYTESMFPLAKTLSHLSQFKRRRLPGQTMYLFAEALGACPSLLLVATKLDSHFMVASRPTILNKQGSISSIWE